MRVPLSPPPGLNSDDTTLSAQGRWADGNNVRFVNGKPETIGYVVPLFTGGTTTAPDARGIFAHTVGVNVSPFLYIGTASTLLYAVNSNGGLGDISPVGLSPGIRAWAFDSFGDTLLALSFLLPGNAGNVLYEWSGSGVAAAVSGAPATINHMLVTPERQVLAFGCNEEASGTFNAMCIRGSDLEDFTDWTTSSTNNAFEHILDGEGRIVAGKVVGNYVAVWTNASLYLGQFIGDPGQAYRFDKVGDGCGLLGFDAVSVLGGVAYWMTPDHAFMRWAPGGLPEVIPCPISRDLRENIGVTGRINQFHTRSTTYSRLGEVWWCYPDARDTPSGATRYVAFNTIDGTWFRGQLARYAITEAPFLYYPGIVPASHERWRPLIGVDSSGNVYSHEAEPTLSGSATTVSWHLQSADQTIDDGGRRVMIRSVEPDFEQQTDDVSLAINVRSRAQETAIAKGPFTLATSTTKKGIRCSGKIFNIKFSGTQGQMRMGKPVFDVVTLGER